jgi:hypothetical protein
MMEKRRVKVERRALKVRIAKAPKVENEAIKGTFSLNFVKQTMNTFKARKMSPFFCNIFI